MPDQFFPYAGVRRSDDDLDAMTAAQILRQHFGFMPDSAGSESGVGDPSGALGLARSRRDQISELEDRLPNEEGAAVIPMEGFVPGEPGRRYTSQLTRSNVITDRARLGQLERDESADPFTGDAAQARTQQVQDALDAAATTQRPEIGDAARTVAERNAFAKYMTERGLKMADYETAASPAAREAALMPIRVKLSGEAQDLADADLERQGRAKMQPQLVPGQRVDPTTGKILDAPVKSAPNTQEEGLLRSIDNTYAVVTDLKGLLHPERNQVSNAISNRLLFPLYTMGIDMSAPGADEAIQKRLNFFGADENTRKRFQLASLVQVLGTTPYANQTRNYHFIEDIRQHLTNPLATDQFLAGQIQELESRLLQFRDTVERVHKTPWQRPPEMPGGDDQSAAPGGNAEISATIRSDPGVNAAPAAAPARHPKYAPPTPDELAEYAKRR